MWFSEADRWNPGSFKTAAWAWPAEVIRPFRDALVPSSIAVKASDFPDGHPPLVTIRFDGSMEKRDADPEEIKGRLFIARAGDLVYSKIDVRNGAIGIVPPHLPVVAVTAEYPVHHVRPQIADVSYVQLLVRSSGLRHEIQSRISGASGRKRIMPSDLLSMRAPFPPLEVQRAIVARAEQAEAALRAGEAKAAGIRRGADAAFLAELGLTLPEERERPKRMTMRWSLIERWGVGYNQAVLGGLDLHSSRFPVRAVGDVLEWMQYGTSQKANTAGRGVAVLRMPNIQDGIIDFSGLKHVELRPAEVGSLILNDGDILINRTNSKELVGKCAVFHGGGEYVFASYLIRLRTRSELADADYLAAVVNGPLGRQQIDALSRQAIGQANINSEEIRALQVPVPPLATQKALVAALSERRGKADAAAADARARRDQAMAEVDSMIQGTVPVAPGGHR